jgi:hypothetical protein
MKENRSFYHLIGMNGRPFDYKEIRHASGNYVLPFGRLGLMPRGQDHSQESKANPLAMGAPSVSMVHARSV